MKYAETLRLFNAIQVVTKDNNQNTVDIFLERTIKNGYILDPAIKPDVELLDAIESIVGLSGEKANAAFHKSWSTIRNTPQETLWLQAIVHYVTTYGFEESGAYREDTVYIPNEILELPETNTGLPLIVIKAMNAGEILIGIIDLGSGIALAEKTLNDIMSIVKANKFATEFFGLIRNRELKALLYDFYGLVPTDPVEFLRHLVSKLTDESLLIKNDYLINKIKESNGKFMDELLKQSPDDLASIFFRYKPLFLAMKSISGKKSFFNRLRKRAVTLHKPMPEDYLNSITALIKQSKLNTDVLRNRLGDAGIFRKIRLAYALKFRQNPGDSIVYRVRNGRGWATEFKWSAGLAERTQEALQIVVYSIAEDVQENVAGKTIYIPSNVYYAMPATEKQFTGFLPTGSYIAVPEDMIVGVHWANTNKRVDLDLSVIGEAGKTGWDSGYFSESKKVLFSGDMTDAPAPKGATELFFLRQGEQEPKVMMLNNYNFEDGDEVEAKILVAHEKPENFGMNYMVDVNNIVAFANINITRKQNILGLIVSVNNENRFYFANVSIGNSITSTANQQSMHVRKFLVNSMVGSLDFKEILTTAGANVVNEKPENEYLDLSPEKLDKNTIIDLIRKP